MTSSSENDALGSVLDLERALETAQTAAVGAEERLELARREADAILAAARDRAESRAAQRQTSLAAAAAAEAEATAGDAEAAAADMRRRASEIEGAFVEAALALVLPPVRGATCSSR